MFKKFIPPRSLHDSNVAVLRVSLLTVLRVLYAIVRLSSGNRLNYEDILALN